MTNSNREWFHSSVAPLWMRVNAIIFMWIFLSILGFIVYSDTDNKTIPELIRILGTLFILYSGALILSKIFIFDKNVTFPEVNERKYCYNCGKKYSILIGKTIKFLSISKGFRFQTWVLMWHCKSCNYDEIEKVKDNHQKTTFVISITFYSCIVWIMLSSLVILSI
ncbi:MAG: hypothetical protein CMB56_001700 [Methanobacteriota archaeon]|nr:MAG: hypothetical protein CMB56_001700 [Euryarchaeota archaeon]